MPAGCGLKSGTKWPIESIVTVNLVKTNHKIKGVKESIHRFHLNRLCGSVLCVNQQLNLSLKTPISVETPEYFIYFK